MAKVVKVTPFNTRMDAVTQQLQTMTPAANRAAAAAQANAQLAPAITGSNLDFQSGQQQYLNAQTRAQEFAKARASQEGAASNLAFDQYDRAAQTLGSLGSGLVGSAANDWNTASQQAQDQVRQMTGGRVANLPSQYATPEMQNAAQTLGVVLPASSLIDQAHLAAAQARGDVAAGARQAEGIASGYGTKMDDAVAQHARDLAAIRAKRPELFQGALDTIQGRADKLSATLNALTAQKAGYETTLAGQQMQRTQAKSNRVSQWEALHHQDYQTGEPLAGWTYDPTDKTGQRMITTQEYGYNLRNDRDYEEKVREWNKTTGEMIRHNKAVDARMRVEADARAQPGYDDKRSKQMGHLVLEDGTPILDQRTGKMIPYTTPTKPPKALGPLDRIKAAGELRAEMKKWRDGAQEVAADGTVTVTQKKLSPLRAFESLLSDQWYTNPATRDMATQTFLNVYQDAKPAGGPTAAQIIDNVKAGRPPNWLPKPKKVAVKPSAEAPVADKPASTIPPALATPTQPEGKINTPYGTFTPAQTLAKMKNPKTPSSQRRELYDWLMLNGYNELLAGVKY